MLQVLQEASTSLQDVATLAASLERVQAEAEQHKQETGRLQQELHAAQVHIATGDDRVAAAEASAQRCQQEVAAARQQIDELTRALAAASQHQDTAAAGSREERREGAGSKQLEPNSHNTTRSDTQCSQEDQAAGPSLRDVCEDEPHLLRQQVHALRQVVQVQERELARLGR